MSSTIATEPIPAWKPDTDSRWKEPARGFSLKAWIQAKKELGIPLTGKKEGFPDHGHPKIWTFYPREIVPTASVL